MTAAKILHALQALVAQPLRSLRSIGDDVGLGRTSIGKHIAPGGQCRRLDSLASFADYPVHSQAIQDALRHLGHGDQAAELASLAPLGKRPRLALAMPTKDVAKPSHHFNAHKLVQALQYFKRREAARSAGRLDDDTLLRSVDEVVGVNRRMVSSWVTTTGKLAKPPESVARLPGYLERREEIRKLLVDFGQAGDADSLPGFVPLRQAVSAASLARALAVLADGPDRTMRAAELASGLARTALNNYLIGANSELFAKTGALPDYGLHSDAMRASLRRMGRQDLAEALPATASQRATEQPARALIPWSAHVFLERAGGNIHKIEAAARLIRTGASTVDAAKQARAHKALILPLLDDKGSLRQPLEVENILGNIDRPAARRIRELLATLARRLDPPTTAAPEPGAAMPTAPGSAAMRMTTDEFLQRASHSLNAVVAAAGLLRSDSTLSSVNAAKSIGASRSVVRVLLDERGGLRHPLVIESLLGGHIDRSAARRIEKLVDRLAERLGEKPLAPVQAMRRLTLQTGMYGKPRVLIVDERTEDPSHSKKESIYKQNPVLVKGPRSFALDRHRQPLRWLSTILKQKFPGSFEVQCYFNSATGQIIASTNRTFLNKRIIEFVRSGELAELLSGPGTQLPIPQSDRSQRHFSKLVGRMNPAADPHSTVQSDAVLAAIAEGRIQVTTRDYREDGTGVAVHAERRLFDHVDSRLGTTLDLSYLAGTMRPCGDCAETVGAAPEVHRGPFFMSRAAGALTDQERNMARAERDGIGTSITRARDGRLTFDHDTDSDSDADFSHDSDSDAARMRDPPGATSSATRSAWMRRDTGTKRKRLGGDWFPSTGEQDLHIPGRSLPNSDVAIGLTSAEVPLGRPPRRASRIGATTWPGNDFDWGKHLRSLGGGEPPAGMVTPHAHHIVFKSSGRGGMMSAYIEESKAILTKHGIDWLMGRENLIWAPNKNHCTAVAKAVRDAIVEADETGSRDSVVTALQRIGESFANNTLSTTYK